MFISRLSLGFFTPAFLFFKFITVKATSLKFYLEPYHPK